MKKEGGRKNGGAVVAIAAMMRVNHVMTKMKEIVQKVVRKTRKITADEDQRKEDDRVEEVVEVEAVNRRKEDVGAGAKKDGAARVETEGKGKEGEAKAGDQGVETVAAAVVVVVEAKKREDDEVEAEKREGVEERNDAVEVVNAKDGNVEAIVRKNPVLTNPTLPKVLT